MSLDYDPTDKCNGTRLKVLTISNELLVGLFQMDGSRRICIKGMPTDAEIVGVSDELRFLHNETSFKIRSQEFEPVPPGQRLPELILECSVILDEPSPYLTLREAR